MVVSPVGRGNLSSRRNGPFCFLVGAVCSLAACHWKGQVNVTGTVFHFPTAQDEPFCFQLTQMPLLRRIAETFQISETAVKRQQRELESRGLILRRREVRNGANHIYLNLPIASCKGTNCTDQNTKRTDATGRKVPSINSRYQLKSSNYYQHGEDESL